MIGKTLSKIFGTRNERELKRMHPVVDRVMELSEEYSSLGDEALVAKTDELKGRVAGGEELEAVLPEAFAVVREAAWRVLKMRHFACQIIGGMVLHEGKIAEMKTGEGKTLMATLPVYLNALSGKGVHVVTVNDYLARRDSQWMGAIYRFLGMKVGVILHGLDDAQRREAYASDIVYGTNNEFGFDYLRDNMKFNLADYVQREFNFAIVDEVDSILIDEARTPLIISGASEESTEKYYVIDKTIPRLMRSTQAEEVKGEEPPDGDFTVDEKGKSTTLTERGVEKVEKLLGVENLFDPRNIEILHHVNQGLRAHHMFKRDIDYVVNDGEVVIVDEFTGRLMPGRRWGEGLHQAVEAKEGVRIASESQTYASITFQNFFRMYDKLAGMTGTAETEAAEFQQTYGLEVLVIPTNKPMVRKDNADVIYRSKKEKHDAVVEEIKERNAKGQPVLVGTITIEESERFSRMLKRKGVKHHVLNAKHHDREAEIVAQAGRFGAVTISTNMAGRGTDIMLGGNPVFLARNDADPETDSARYEERLAYYEAQCAAEREEVLTAGGLHILGTERHESRRIDNQLRGRSGRQGDPGSSVFYLSLEDDLMRIFGSERISGLLSKLGLKDGEDIQHPWISKAIENAQTKVEGHNFDIRKHLLEYDDVMNRQRESIYGWRRDALGGESLVEEVKEIAESLAVEIVEERCPPKESVDKWDVAGMREALFKQFHMQLMSSEEELKAKKDTLADDIASLVLGRYDQRLEEFGEHTDSMQRYILLHNIDSHWKDHLLALDHLKKGVGLQGYAQKNPLVIYKQEGYQLFIDMRHRIEELTIEQLYRIQLAKEEAPPEEIQKPTKETQVVLSHGTGGGEQEEKTVKKSGPEVGRNDPCPCGSGKKYKKCCGRGL